MPIFGTNTSSLEGVKKSINDKIIALKTKANSGRPFTTPEEVTTELGALQSELITFITMKLQESQRRGNTSIQEVQNLNAMLKSFTNVFSNLSESIVKLNTGVNSQGRSQNTNIPTN